jgi:hypothetical protein
MIRCLVGLIKSGKATAKSLYLLLFVLSSSLVFAQAPTVNTPTVTAITTTGATLGGTVTGTLTHRGTRWSTTSPVGTSNQQEEASAAAGAFTQARTALPSAARIFFVAYARNNADAGTTAETVFVTEPLQLSGGQLTATANGSTTINLTFPTANSWAGTGATAGYVIYRNAGSAPALGALADGAAPPVDGTGDKIATITNGTATGFSDSGLTSGTNYYYTVVPFAWDGSAATTYNYNLTAPQTANDFTFATEPSGHATGTLTANAISSSQINLSFNSVTTSGITNATGYIVLIKSSAIVAADLATLTDGAAPNAFGLFEAIINSTSDNSYNDIAGLSPNTTYHYAIIPYNRGGDDHTYNYLTTAGFATGSGTTNDISATFNPLPGGTAQVPLSTVLSAGVNLQVVAGYTVTSDGTQVINDINFNYSGLTTQFTDEYLYRSTSAGSIGTQLLSDNSPDGNFSLASVSVPNKTINSTTVYYYLVVDVSNAVTQATSGITVSPTQANITVVSGIVNPFSLNRTVTFNTSQLSDIVFANDGTTASITYRSFQGTSIGPGQPAPPNSAASVSLGDFLIRDGGAAADPDNRSTSVTSITIQLTNFGNLRQIALFDDNNDTEIDGTEQTVSGSTVTFTPTSAIVVPDNGSFRINIRASFLATVTDKQTINITITGVTTSINGSGFAAIDAGGATTSPAGANAIAVVASRLVFTANPPATVVNTNFSLTVRAIDQPGFGNLDLDYTGKVDLEASSSGSGILVGGAQTLSPNLVAGVFAWTQLQINQVDLYNLVASDDEYLDAPENQSNVQNAIGNVNITATASTITQPPTLNLCYGSIFKNLGNIVITETSPSGFSSSGTFSIGLPTGYIFDTSVTTAPVISNGTAAPSTLSYTGDNIVQFSYNFTAGSSNTNSITIQGLRVRYPLNTAPSGGGNITRVGGTASISGVVDGTVLGTVNATLGTPSGSVGFTVVKVNSGDVDVEANETRFSSTGNAVRLVGSPTGVSSEFTGPGVTFTAGQWRFNPTSLAVGTGYTITYKVREGPDQCEFTFSKDFEVYATNITNLSTSYCSNEDPSDPLSVSEAYIDSRFYDFLLAIPTYHYNFDGFVYFDPTFGYRELNPIVPPTIPGNPATATYVFDPQLQEYSDLNIYSNTELYYGTYGIWIGFRVKNPTNSVRYEFVLIPVRQAPTATITSLTNTLLTTNSRFCRDNLPVTLVGSPANSSSSGLDFFTVDSAPQAGSVSFSAGTSTWSFNPASVSGVTEATPVTFNISYTFTDKVTNCEDTSPPIQIRVYARPASVISANITANEDQEICPGSPVSIVTANPTGVEYKWYNNIFPLEANPLAIGNSFTPPTDVLTPGVYEYNVTRTIGKETFILLGNPIIKFSGCESNRPNSPTPFNVSVTVKPIPSPPTIPNIAREYCVNSTVSSADLQVTGTNVRWYRNGAFVFAGSSPSAANLGINNSIAGDYTFSLTQTINGCEGVVQTTAPFTDQLSVKIKPLPELSILSSSVPDLLKICTTGGIIKFEARDGAAIAPNGTWSGAGLSGVLTPNAIVGSVDVNPSTLAPGAYTLQYNYTNAATLCSRIVSVNFNILPSINVAVSMSSACLGSSITITNSSTMNGTGSIDSVTWDFDDNSGLALGFYSDSVNANNERTTGIYGAPRHRYTNTGNYQVSGRMVTNEGCFYSIPAQGVLISPLPTIDFTWRNVCRDEITGLSNTQFLAVEQSTPQLAIANYNWNFTLNNSLAVDTVMGSGSNRTVAYSSNGRDSVRLIAITAAGCQDTVKKPVYIVPTYLKIMGDTTYNQNFNATSDSWIAGGINSSWRWDTLSVKGTEEFATRGNGWDTDHLTGGKNFNNPNEQSWVLSQCFNFSVAKRPVIALDIFSDSPYQVNGAVLQYNLTGNIEADGDWITLGDVGQGINWYDASGISNPPGNQSANDIGWTGNPSTTNQKYNSWVRAIHRLDVGSLNGASNVVFRIAFASGNTLSDGFAFDNVFIGERTRKVLVENFTNSNIPNINVHNEEYQNEGSPTEIVKIQYHTPFPGPGTDPVNSLNPAMHNSRTAFYGITESKTARIDGLVRPGLLENWLVDLYEDRVLTPSPLKITINPVKVGEIVEIEIVIENVSGQTIPTRGAHIFTTIVEQSITDAAFLSSSGNSEFVFVAKEMLPSPTGLQIPDNLNVGETYTSPKITWRLQNGDAIAVMVQSIEGNDKNVFQSEIFIDPPMPDVITAIENLSEHITIYPNPANESFEIELPFKAEHRLLVNLIDPVGRAAQQLYFEKGEQTKTVNTQHLAQGIYVVQIGSGKTGVVRKKVMVVH